MSTMDENDISAVQRFYRDTTVLITGATGFVGKALLEKLLRACPDVKAVYLLVRAKKGQHIEARVEHLFEDVVFGPLLRDRPKLRHKVRAIGGDCSLPGLGINQQDRQMLQEQVNIVFHGAATVRFDEKLRLATTINVKGCAEMLNLCKEMPHLKSLIHISTAFANCPQSFIEERFYSPGVHHDKLIALVSAATDDIHLEHITKSLIQPWPNTYTFTKAVAEHLVCEESGNLAVGVFRPSIVVSTYREPVKAWVDNLYGATGVCAGAGVGVLHTLHCDSKAIANITPVDTTVNALICSAWDVVKRRQQSKRNSGSPTDKIVPIYNYVSTDDNSLSWGKFMNLCESNGIQYPSTKAMWYYSLTLNKYWLIHWLYVILFHLIPGAIIDLAMTVAGKKPRMLRVYKHIIRYSEAISYFCLNTWNFRYDNVVSMWEGLDKEDQKNFFFDMRQIDWDEFFQEHMLGVRKYLLKDLEDTLPQAKIKWRIFYVMHQLLKLAFCFGALRMTWFIASVFIQ